MNRLPYRLARAVLLALLGTAACFAQTPAEDEAWIERAMQARPKASTGAGSATATVAFSELSGLAGVPLRVTLRDGRVRHGTLDRADREGLVLQQSLKGGSYAFRVPRGEVARIVREDG